MSDITVRGGAFQVEDRSWLLGPHGTDPGSNPNVTLLLSLFDEATHYPNGYIPSGIVLGRVTASGVYGPSTSDASTEVQTVTVGGSGLTSFTLTFSGQTTASLDDQATAAQVQAALEDLSNVGEGNVSVSGDAGGVWTVTFTGELAGTNVAQMTSTPTGGTGSVTVATATGGGADGSADGRETAAGFLFGSLAVQSGATRLAGAMLVHGFVDPDRLPIPLGSGSLSAGARTDLTHISFKEGA